jgi:HEPN domain-containing protein
MKLKKGDYKQFALEDLAQMGYNSKNGFEQAKSTCMHAQQYVEKMIKDKIVELFDTEPEKTHNLRVLLAAIIPEGLEIDPDLMLKAGILSDYYMATRYPDFKILSEITEETAEEAYRWSLEIVSFVDSIRRDEDGMISIEQSESDDQYAGQ